MTMRTVAVVVFGCVTVFALHPSTLVAGYAQKGPAIIAEEWHIPRPIIKHDDPCCSYNDEENDQPRVMCGYYPGGLDYGPSESLPSFFITRFVFGLLLQQKR